MIVTTFEAELFRLADAIDGTENGAEILGCSKELEGLILSRARVASREGDNDLVLQLAESGSRVAGLRARLSAHRQIGFRL